MADISEIITQIQEQIPDKGLYKLTQYLHDKVLPVLMRICEFGIPAALLLYSIIDQQGAKELVYSKPMDNLGILEIKIEEGIEVKLFLSFFRIFLLLRPEGVP